MLQALRKAVALPSLNVGGALSAVTVAAFLWLLAQNAIQPLAIVLLELYLAF
jgi:hypothetical protein